MVAYHEKVKLKQSRLCFGGFGQRGTVEVDIFSLQLSLA
jgi:hypothetical protein